MCERRDELDPAAGLGRGMRGRGRKRECRAAEGARSGSTVDVAVHESDRREQVASRESEYVRAPVARFVKRGHLYLVRHVAVHDALVPDADHVHGVLVGIVVRGDDEH